MVDEASPESQTTADAAGGQEQGPPKPKRGPPYTSYEFALIVILGISYF